MKRICLTLLTLCASISLLGCCYRPCGIDPHRGVAYGGGWEPQCAGPLDPLGFWCCLSRNWCGAPGPYNGGYQSYNPYGSPYGGMNSPVHGGNGCATCGTEPMMATPTFAPQSEAPMMQEQQPSPGGGLKPVPDPMMKQQEKSNGSMTYVMPPSVPMMRRPAQFVPAQQRGVLRTTHQPPVQAF